jgi:YHS domain-containing protein
MRILRQWEDDDEVCSLYTFDVQAPARAASLLVSELNTVRDGKVASSLMVFDTGTFQTAGVEASQAVDPVCGMTVDAEQAKAKGLTTDHEGTTYYFCGRGCKLEFGDDPGHYLDPSYRSSM